MLRKIGLLGIALAAMMLPAQAADNYPSKPIRLIVGFAPGGGTNLLARVLADKLPPLLGGATIIVENKPGGGGTVAAGDIVRAAPDGYTLLLGTSGMMSSAPYAQSPRPYDPITDFQPATLLAISQLQILVKDDFPAKDFKEFVALAKANPGKYTYATAGLMGPGHLFAELLSRQVGIGLRHVPYAGDGKSAIDVLAGFVPVWAAGAGAFHYAQQGKVRPLVTSGEKRWPQYPDTPSVVELGYPKAATNYYNVLLAPKGTPAAITDKLYKAVVEVYKDPDAVAKIKASGVFPETMPAAETAAYIKQDVELWKDIVTEMAAKK
jgi:tripartite-type tricarboxylate transporter receptor subunit TctC